MELVRLGDETNGECGTRKEKYLQNLSGEYEEERQLGKTNTCVRA